MKLYNKPELNVEQFDVEDIITTSTPDTTDSVNGGYDKVQGLSAGMEFDINVDGNEF